MGELREIGELGELRESFHSSLFTLHSSLSPLLWRGWGRLPTPLAAWQQSHDCLP